MDSGMCLDWPWVFVCAYGCRVLQVDGVLLLNLGGYLFISPPCASVACGWDWGGQRALGPNIGWPCRSTSNPKKDASSRMGIETDLDAIIAPCAIAKWGEPTDRWAWQGSSRSVDL
jgi:hypothetical protein